MVNIEDVLPGHKLLRPKILPCVIDMQACETARASNENMLASLKRHDLCFATKTTSQGSGNSDGISLDCIILLGLEVQGVGFPMRFCIGIPSEMIMGAHIRNPTIISMGAKWDSHGISNGFHPGGFRRAFQSPSYLHRDIPQGIPW